MITSSGLVVPTRQISATEFAEMTGIHQALQRDWRRRRLIGPTPSGGYTLEDVIYAGILKAISDAGLSPKRHRHAAKLGVPSALFSAFQDSFVVTIAQGSSKTLLDLHREVASRCGLVFSSDPHDPARWATYLAIRHPIHPVTPADEDEAEKLAVELSTTFDQDLAGLGGWMETGSRDEQFDGLVLNRAAGVTLIDLSAVADRIGQSICDGGRGPLLVVPAIYEAAV
jgi:DNA-binding transcriptional MerR regulator